MNDPNPKPEASVVRPAPGETGAPDTNEDPQPTAEERARPGFSYAKWYEDNKTAFNATRKERYQQDPHYREKVLKWNRDSRGRLREKLDEERRAQGEAAVLHAEPQHFKTVPIEIVESGIRRTVDGHTIGALAKYLNRSIQVIRLWENDGVIPKTPYKNAKGDRLYTSKQIEEIHALLESQGRLRDQGNRQPQNPRAFLYEVHFADGTVKPMALYKVGVVAAALGRTIVTIEQMEQREALPPTPFRASATSYRLYTLDMIRAIKEAFNNNGQDVRGEERRVAFYNEVLEAWTRLQVVGAKLGDSIKSTGKDASSAAETDDE